MNIRKFFMSAVITVMVLATTPCFAQVPTDDLFIKGIYPGQPWDELIGLYGQPSSVQEPCEESNYKTIYHYYVRGGGSFSVQKENERIVSIFVIGTKLMTTTRGIRVGSTKADVLNAYGNPDEMSSNSNGQNLVLSYLTGKPREEIRFLVDGYTGKVHWISIEGSPNSIRSSSSKAPSSPTQKSRSTIPDSVTEMPVSELNLGWIEPGQPMSKVEEVYGKPGRIDDQGFFQIYNYNDKFIVKGKMSNGYKVTSVASYEKGIKTPSGFMVGDAYSAIVKKFGSVNGMNFNGDELEAKMKNLKGCKDYTYFSGKKQMVFLVDKKGIVQAIRVEDYDEQKFIESRRKK